MGWWRSLTSKFQFVVRVLVAFAIARIILGVIMIAFFDRDAVAWSYELTALLALGVLLSFAAAMAVRRWSPPRKARRDVR
jgi:hypothetical protein